MNRPSRKDLLWMSQNYTTYDTFYQLNKEIEEDPRCKTVDAKRQIARFVELHETNIAQRVEVIVEHFRTTVMPELGGMAKAMVITASRQVRSNTVRHLRITLRKRLHRYQGIGRFLW